MADENFIENMILQDELPLIVTLEMFLKTEIKGHHVYKDICMKYVVTRIRGRLGSSSVAKKYIIDIFISSLLS